MANAQVPLTHWPGRAIQRRPGGYAGVPSGPTKKSDYRSYDSLMTDSTDHLAAAIRQVVDDAIQAALRANPPPLPPPELPKPVDEWPPKRKLYPLTEVQKKLSIGRSTVYQLVGDGQLPSVKIGRRRFVTAAALDAYVEGLK